MPIFRFKCESCYTKKSKFLSPKDAKKGLVCKCGERMVRDYGDNNAIIKKTIDNGIMPKRVEQYANSPDLIKERVHAVEKDKKKKTL